MGLNFVRFIICRGAAPEQSAGDTWLQAWSSCESKKQTGVKSAVKGDILQKTGQENKEMKSVFRNSQYGHKIKIS